MNAPARRPALLLAAAASVAAGMVHAAASAAHADDATLAALFALVAVLQVGWAGAAVARPGSPLLLAGIVLHGGALAVWGASRTTGVGVIGVLADAQDLSFQDGVTAALEVVAVLGAVAALRPASAVSPSRPWRPAFGVAAGAGLVALTLPAMAFPHDHAHDHVVDRDLVARGQHAHAATGDHSHPDELGADRRIAGAPGIATTSAEQRRRAVDLIDRTVAAIARYSDPSTAEAAGYRSIGDGFTGYEHFVNRAHLADPAVLDPATIESLVYQVLPDGSRVLASGMYILPPGTTMADVPDVAGPLTVWHDHQNLCWNPDGSLAGVLVDGQCRPGGTFRPTPPMLHVWVVEHPCGPFAGIEGSHGAGCEHDHG